MYMKKSGNRNHAGRTAAFRWAFLLVALPPLLAAFPAPASGYGPTGCKSILTNGSFETTPQPVANGGFEHFSDIGGEDVAGWDLEIGSGIEILRNFGGTAAEGDHWIELAAREALTISQSVTTVPGALYELRFAYSARPFYGADNKFRVTWGDAQQEIQSAAVGTNTWQYASLTAKAPAGGGKVTFQDLSGGDAAAGMFIDDVTLCRVPGLAKKCCCGGNEVYAFTQYPHLSWALLPNGNVMRLWWDQMNHQEELSYEDFRQPLVSGSLRRDPFGDGVLALSDRGDIVRAFEQDGEWSTELILQGPLGRLGRVRSCALVTTFDGDFNGIYAVTKNHIVRIYQEVPGGPWRLSKVKIGGFAAQIVPTALHEISGGRIVGVLENGQRWNVWHHNNDPKKMRFGFSPGELIAVSPAADCGE